VAQNGRIQITFERERKTLRSLLSFFNRGHRVEHADGNGVVAPVDMSKAERFLATLVAKYGPLPAGATDIVTDSIATLVLDGPALLALAAGHPRARAYVTWAVRMRTRVVVPATAFLDPEVAAIAGSVADIVPIYASTAEVAATLIAHARLSLPIDALHVALASKLRPAAILTRDPNGVRALVNAADQSGVVVFTL
jgi:predicted nucleic acid-binding protein